MPAIKLTYFNLKARAEPARLILAQAGKDYEDNRIPAPWDDIAPWNAMKPNTPFGQLPVLCYDGSEIGQSMTIARFLAKEFGLAGANNVESARMDAVVDAVSEATEKQYIAFLFEKSEEKQKKFSDEALPALFKSLEKQVSGDFMFGSSVSWADIILFHFVDSLPSKDALKDYPKVAAVSKRVGELPNIKKWVETRPETTV